jgi:hypothetical protein
MCVACTPGLKFAFQSLSFPSRRGFLKCGSALAGGSVFLVEAVGPDAARTDGEMNESLTRGLEGAPTEIDARQVTIFTPSRKRREYISTSAAR